MPGKRFTAEQIVAKLREAEKLQAQGSTIPAVCKRLQVSEQTPRSATLTTLGDPERGRDVTDGAPGRDEIERSTTKLRRVGLRHRTAPSGL